MATNENTPVELVEHKRMCMCSMHTQGWMYTEFMTLCECAWDYAPSLQGSCGRLINTQIVCLSSISICYNIIWHCIIPYADRRTQIAKTLFYSSVYNGDSTVHC